MRRFDGRVVVVSGASSGIGAAAARRFATEGARVVVSGRRADRLRAVADAIDGLAVVGDIGEPQTADALVTAATERFDGIDVVVANAGVGFGGGVDDVADDAWERTIDVNLTGAMRLVRAAVPQLAGRPGASVVLVSSVSGLVAAPSSVAYVAAKAGVLGLTRSIAVDLAPRGIRANAVIPGWVRTEMGDAAMRELIEERGIPIDEAYVAVTGAVPMRRPAEPAEVAACIAFLASDDASYVTGASLAVDGGLLAVDVGALAFAGPAVGGNTGPSQAAGAEGAGKTPGRGDDHAGGEGPAR